MFRLVLLSVSFYIASSSLIFGDTRSPGTTRRLDGEGGDSSWMYGYTMAYGNCFYTSNTVAFKLCPEDSDCEHGCNGGGEYLVDLNYFVDAFTEAQMHAREYICEQVRENCDDDDEEQCYENAGLDYCNWYYDEDEFNVQEYLECAEFGDDGYYVGPYCADDNYNIYLGFFKDDACSKHADEGKFYDLYGYELEYSTTSIIENECAWCWEHGMEEHQNYEDQEDEDDILEQCEDLYEAATKCEQDMDVDNPDTGGCSSIAELKTLENVGRRNGGSPPTKFFWFFFISALVIGIAVECYVYHEKHKKNKKGSGLSPSHSLI